MKAIYTIPPFPSFNNLISFSCRTCTYICTCTCMGLFTCFKEEGLVGFTGRVGHIRREPATKEHSTKVSQEKVIGIITKAGLSRLFRRTLGNWWFLWT